MKTKFPYLIMMLILIIALAFLWITFLKKQDYLNFFTYFVLWGYSIYKYVQMRNKFLNQ